LNRANQGILEFGRGCSRAHQDGCTPLLTATQEGKLYRHRKISVAIPFTGIVLAHSNEAEWQSFKANKNTRPFIDRICVIKLPLLPPGYRRAEDLRENSFRDPN